MGLDALRFQQEFGPMVPFIKLNRLEVVEIAKEAEQNRKADDGLESEMKDADGVVTAICKGSYQLQRKVF